MAEPSAARDRQLEEQALECEQQATKLEQSGRWREATLVWAQATFYRDCMSARARRFRGRRVQRQRRAGR